MNNNKKKLEYTGERITNTEKTDLFLSTEARYTFAKKYIKKSDTVLDIGCGTGYGSFELSKKAKKVIGADVDKESIEYSESTYGNKNREFILIEPEKRIEKFKNKFDVVVSYETIEHVQNAPKFLEDLQFYLKKNGTLILSTPNNYYKKHPPSNPFHVYEFNILELFKLIQKKYTSSKIEVFGQHKMVSKRDDKEQTDSFFKLVIKKLVWLLYLLDLKTLNVLNKLQHVSLYKKVGRLQRDEAFDVSIYPINPEENFYIPRISVFVVTSK